MFAWIIEQHGGLEVLKQKERPSPTPGIGEVLLKLRALGLNHLDLWVRKGVKGHNFPLPLIPGCDIVGEIIEFGILSENENQFLKKVGFKKGDRVLVNPVLSCGECEACKNGFEPTCTGSGNIKGFGLLGETCDGGAAEFITVPFKNINPLSDSISDEKAAAIPVSGITAWSMIHRKAALKKGEVVLIQAGSSGVSSYAIQMARNTGASMIISSAGTDEKLEKLKSLGATHVFNYKKTDLVKEVKTILPAGKRGVDVVVEHVGGSTFEQSLKLLEWGGRLVTCGATTGAIVQLNLNALFFKNLSILGATMGGGGDFSDLLCSVEKGLIEPQVHKVFDFKEYDKAQAEVENPNRFGKVIIKF